MLIDILLCIADYLNHEDLLTLSLIYPVLYYDESFWKVRCRNDYSVTYNDPSLTYRELYKACVVKPMGRLPCTHLDTNAHYVQVDVCSQCQNGNLEYLFICTDCGQVLCDRHTRHHARLGKKKHQVYYKPNMSEFFCQACLDWIGGMDSYTAEIYYASSLSLLWMNTLCLNDQKTLELKQVRQKERSIRWKDTPRHVLKDGLCLLPLQWITVWEDFIEGWKTERPKEAIDCTVEITNLQHVSIISSSTWSYLRRHYMVIGDKITEDNLVSKNLLGQLQAWKKRIH